MERPRIADETDFVNHVDRIYWKDGPRLLAVVKATFVLKKAGAPLEVAPYGTRSHVRLADEPWGDPARSPIRYPTDWVAEKSGSDVVFVGSAHAPNGKRVSSFEASISVGGVSSRLRACGPRVFGENGDAVSAPGETGAVPIRWDLAWGGYDASVDGKVVEESRNPMGRGVVLDRAKLTHMPAPQLETADEPIRSASAKHSPAGFGAVSRHFEPRRSRSGSYDSKWHAERAPLPPLDEDPLFHSVAAPGLFSPRPFAGGEPVELWNLTPSGGAVSFALPAVRLRIEIRVPGREPKIVTPPPDSVWIDASAAEGPLVRVELGYRASVPAPDRLGDATVLIHDER